MTFIVGTLMSSSEYCGSNCYAHCSISVFPHAPEVGKHQETIQLLNGCKHPTKSHSRIEPWGYTGNRHPRSLLSYHDEL